MVGVTQVAIKFLWRFGSRFFWSKASDKRSALYCVNYHTWTRWTFAMAMP